VFLVPIGSVVVFSVDIGFGLLPSVVSTIIVFLVCSVVFYLYFHRNPKRDIVSDDRAVLSPADGTIVYIKEIQRGTIIESVKQKKRMRLTELLDIKDADSSSAIGYIIGIELRLFDVHVTRAPITGVKLFDHHVSGRIVSMGNPDFEYINDRETVLLQKNDYQTKGTASLRIAVVQIATFLTRTVKSYVREKTRIIQGEPLGMIQLGSQVDLVLYSTDVHILVKEHDRVYAGVTKIAEITAP
jgi:phosphatidylserine decarboxylase